MLAGSPGPGRPVGGRRGRHRRRPAGGAGAGPVAAVPGRGAPRPGRPADDGPGPARRGAPTGTGRSGCPTPATPAASGRMLSADPELSTRLVEGRLEGRGAASATGPRPSAARPPGSGPTLLVVVDDESLTEGRKAPDPVSCCGATAVRWPASSIASTADRLPAVCTTVVEMTDPDGGADLTLPQRGERIERLPAGGHGRRRGPRLRPVAGPVRGPRARPGRARGCPASIRLLPLLELEECTPDAVLARWKAGGRRPPPGRARRRGRGRRVLGRLRGRRPPRPGRRHHRRRASPSCCARWWPAWPPASTPTT